MLCRGLDGRMCVMKTAMLAAMVLALAPAARGEWLPGAVTLSDGAPVHGDL
jgi:hypothetical protein